MKSIVTRSGDGGETGLLYGGRIAKDDPHAEAYGALDEAVSHLGVARAGESRSDRAERLLALQRELFVVGTELATAATHRDQMTRHFPPCTAAMVDAIEDQVRALEATVPIPPSFVVPGGSPTAAALDVARAVIRRCERAAVTLLRTGRLANPEVVRYLNRCSDLLFMLAREAEGGATVAR